MKNSIKAGLFAVLLGSAFIFCSNNSLAADDSGINAKIDESSNYEQASPGILPTNPFYFLKKMRWGFQRLLATGPIKKIDLEVQIQENSLLEVKKLQEIDLINENSVTKTLSALEGSLDRLISITKDLKSHNIDKKDLSSEGQRIITNWTNLKSIIETINSSKEEIEATSSKVSQIFQNINKFVNSVE